MPLLENTDRDSPLTFLLAALVAKLRFKPENTLSWNAIGMTPPCDHVTSSSTTLSTFLQTTLKHLVSIMDKVPSQHSSLEQKHSLHYLVSFASPSLLYFFCFLPSSFSFYIVSSLI